MADPFPIPDAALDDRLGFIGTAGAGKTYTALTAFLRVLARGGRGVWVDPLGVAWGIRLMANGKTASPWPVVIFGGAHGDLAVNEHAGKLIGETVAGMTESAIVDLSHFGTKAAERRFMLAFLEAMYRKAGGAPFHLVLDEADLWAPQKASEPQLQALTEQIVRRGRVKGFIPWLITQRPAVLSKDVLSQVDGLVALKLTSSQDRDAIGAWIEGQADKGEWAKIRAELPTLQRGHGVVWIPGRQILETVAFPPKPTFDSSASPTRGKKGAAIATLQPLDVGALRERLATVEKEQKASDPRELKARIAELERQLNARPSAGKVGPDPAAIAVAREEGARTGFTVGYRAGSAAEWQRGTSAIGAELVAVADDGRALARRLAALVQAIDTIGRKPGAEPPADAIAAFDAAKLTYKSSRPSQLRDAPPVKALAEKPVLRQAERAPTITSAASNEGRKSDMGGAPASGPGSGSGAGLAAPLQKIVDAIAWWNVLGIAEPSYPQVGFRAGYSPKGGTFNRYLSELRSRALIVTRGKGASLTADGERAAAAPDAPPTGEELRATILASIDGPLARLLAPLIDAWPERLSKGELGTRAGYEAAGGTFNRYLSSLRSLQLVTGRGSEIAAEDWMFP